MACVIAGNGGPRSITGGVDDEGYQTYRVVHRVRCDPLTDTAAAIANTPGLPAVGAPYSFLGDFLPDVYCRFSKNITMVRSRDSGPCKFYDVEQTFSNKPVPADKQRCSDASPGNPLLEPQKVSGSFVRYTEEATKDRFGNDIKNSAHEQIRGPQVEFDANRPTVHIEQNVADLQLPLLAEFMRDGGMLNDSELWGVIPRGVRLSQVSWTENYYGTCFKYYTRTFDFEINVKRSEGMQGVVGVITAAPGSGYAVGDIITISGGDFSVPAVLMVTTIAIGGLIGDVTILNAGQYRSPPGSPSSGSTNGSGSGATFFLTFGETLSSGWDRDLLDEGTKALNGDWGENGGWELIPLDVGELIFPDKNDPSHFCRITDRKGNYIRAILNQGVPIDVSGTTTSGTADNYPGVIHVEKYPQDNLLLLGIPLTIGV